MKKFILVVFIGMVLAINLYGFASDFAKMLEEAERAEEIATVVYME